MSVKRITPFTLRKKTRKTMFDQPENKTRKRSFHPDLEDCARSREEKLV